MNNINGKHSKTIKSNLIKSLESAKEKYKENKELIEQKAKKLIRDSEKNVVKQLEDINMIRERRKKKKK